MKLHQLWTTSTISTSRLPAFLAIVWFYDRNFPLSTSFMFTTKLISLSDFAFTPSEDRRLRLSIISRQIHIHITFHFDYFLNCFFLVLVSFSNPKISHTLANASSCELSQSSAIFLFSSLFTDPLFFLQSPSSAGDKIYWNRRGFIDRAHSRALADVFEKNEKKKIKQRLCTGHVFSRDPHVNPTRVSSTKIRAELRFVTSNNQRLGRTDDNQVETLLLQRCASRKSHVTEDQNTRDQIASVEIILVPRASILLVSCRDRYPPLTKRIEALGTRMRRNAKSAW